MESKVENWENTLEINHNKLHKISELMKQLELNNLFNENTYKRALIINNNNITCSLNWIEQNLFTNTLEYLTSDLDTNNDIKLILECFQKKWYIECNNLNRIISNTCNGEKDIIDCDSILRLNFMLKLYSDILKLESKFSDRHISLVNILSNHLPVNYYHEINAIFSDYHHVYQHHTSTVDNSVHIFRFMVRIYGNSNKCDLKTCNYFQRTKRNCYYTPVQYEERNINLKNDDTNRDISMRRLLDEIHWNLIHYDLYGRDIDINQLNEEKEPLIVNNLKMDDVVKDLQPVDEKKTSNTISHPKSSKFVTNVIHTDAYDHGQGFDYYGYHNEMNDTFIFIKPKYSSIKEELLTNIICKISQWQWNEIYDKAVYLLSVIKSNSYFKARQHNLEYNEHFCKLSDTRCGKLMGLDNILAIILYTDFTNMCGAFRATFRLYDNKGQLLDKKLIKQNHSEYANWARILHETISFFGNNCDYNESYYHGLNKVFQFKQHVICLRGPVSTSLYFNVASTFAGRNGMIIEFNVHQSLSNVDNKYGMSVEFFSAYKHEKEILFYDPIFVMVHISIYNVQSYHFKYLLNGLILMQSILDGNIETIELYKSRLLSKCTQQYLICLLIYVMGKNPEMQHECTDYFKGSIHKFVSTIGSCIFINKRYISGTIDVWEAKLLELLFDDVKCFGPGPFIKYLWQSDDIKFHYGFSSLQYFNHKSISMNIQSTDWENDDGQTKIVNFCKNGPTFTFEFCQQDDMLCVEISIVKIPSIYGLPMNSVLGYCYITIPETQWSPVRIDFNGGIDQTLNYQRVCPIKKCPMMSEIILDMIIMCYQDQQGVTYHKISHCNLDLVTNGIHFVENTNHSFLLLEQSKNSACFHIACLLKYEVFPLVHGLSTKCDLCNEVIQLKRKFYYKCSMNHICCIKCFVGGSN